MRLSIKEILNSKYKIAVAICLAIIVGIIYSTFFRPISASETTQYVYIDDDDSVDSVFQKVETAACGKKITGFRTLMRHSGYGDNIHTGRYAIEPGEITFTTFRKIKNEQQSAMNLTIPSVRTLDRLSVELSKRLMLDSLSLLDTLRSPAVCQRYGYDTLTVICMFIPNTYEVFWNIPITSLLDRMKKESDRFWTDERRQKASVLMLSPVEVMTLASIVDEETANDAEKPMIAGMYYNRLKIEMPLQADPTVKFARQDFAARRIYRAWLDTDSPYNTYKNTGLPPGPIRIPSIAGIDAVLNLTHHDYLYMCAKEDFSGTHNFAATYDEHRKNARAYAKALNERGIK